jgi:hypothetical protein
MIMVFASLSTYAAISLGPFTSVEMAGSYDRRKVNIDN